MSAPRRGEESFQYPGFNRRKSLQTESSSALPERHPSAHPIHHVTAITTAPAPQQPQHGSESLDILSGLASGMAKLSEPEARGTKRSATTMSSTEQHPVILPVPVPKHPRRQNVHLPLCMAPVRRPPAVRIIQDWHAVLGDKHSGNRTTTATKIFKEVKQWYKQNKSRYRSSLRQSDLLGDAMKVYFQRVAAAFPNDFPTEQAERLETILIHCSSKASESNRVQVAHCFRYETDTTPKYGIAAIPMAIVFCFESRDAPTLEYDVSKYRRELGALERLPPSEQPSTESIEYFASLLDFCEQQIEKSKSQDIARQFLELINLRTTMKQLWQSLKGAGGSDSEDAGRPKSWSSS